VICVRIKVVFIIISHEKRIHIFIYSVETASIFKLMISQSNVKSVHIKRYIYMFASHLLCDLTRFDTVRAKEGQNTGVMIQFISLDASPNLAHNIFGREVRSGLDPLKSNYDHRQ